KHCRNVILTGDNGTVAERAADISNDAGGEWEQGSPCWRRDFCDENVPSTHLAKLFRTANHARHTGGTTRASDLAFDGMPCDLPCRCGCPGAQIDSHEPRPFDRQHHWRCCLALSLPKCAPFGHNATVIGSGFIPIDCASRDFDLVQLQPENIA